MDENEKLYKVVAREAPIVSVSATFQGIGTLEFPPILADTNIFFYSYENTDKKYLRPNMEITGYFVICTVFFLFIPFYYHLYKGYISYHIHMESCIQLYIFFFHFFFQVLEPCFTSPSFKFSIKWYRPSK